MRGDELLDVIENINPTLIERASRKPKRPWLRWTAVAACLAMVVGLCALFLPGKGPANGTTPTIPTLLDTPSDPSTPVQVQPVKYTIYSGFVSMDESPGVPNGDVGPQPSLQPDTPSNSPQPDTPSDSPPSEGNTTPSVNYYDISDLDFSYIDREDFVNNSAAPSVDFTFAGRTLHADYSRSFTNALYQNEDPNLRLLGSYDEYDGENFTVRFRQGDGAITFFAYTDDWSVGGSMTDEKVKELGDAFVAELFGEGFLTEYASHTIAHSSNNREQTISACYTKIICGYETTDRVIVTYNMRGEIVGYNANTKGVFDGAEDVITPEAIAAAEEYLLSHVPSEWRVGDKKLVMDADGTFYLYVGMVTNKDGICMTYEMCINIT